MVVFFLPWKVKVREKITELHLPSLFDDGWFLHWLDSSITRVALHLQPKYLLQLMLVVSQEKGKQCDMMIIKLPHKKTDFGNWYSNLLIFVIGPIKTIVKNAICPFCPLRITSSPPIRYISNGKLAPKFDLVFTFHWGFLSTYLLIIISGTHLLTIFWALQFTPSSCCDDTNFGKKMKA